MTVFVKYMVHEFKNASRNKRELDVAKELGFKVIVRDASYTEPEGIYDIDGYTVYRRKKKKINNKIIKQFQKVIDWYIKEPIFLRKLNADIISCYDLTALLIGWLSTIFIIRSKKPKLIYDSHEFELGCRRNLRRSNFTKFIIKKVEGFLIKRCDLSIMVNDSIVDEIVEIYNPPLKPISVRNIPEFWNVDNNITNEKRNEFIKMFPDEIKDHFFVMYHGGIKSHRGIEELIDSLKYNENFQIVVLGFIADADYDYFMKLFNRNENKGRVIYKKGVKIDELWKYVGAMDCGIAPINGELKSYYLSLPNKIFECIQSETPIICSNYPEMKKVVVDNNIGLGLDNLTPEDIALKIKMMQEDKKSYTTYKENIRELKKELCWENEKKKLISAYRALEG